MSKQLDRTNYMKANDLHKHQRRIAVTTACVSVGWLCWSGGSVGDAQTAPADLAPGVAEVVKLTQAQMSEDVILSYIRNSGLSPSLSADDIIYLNSKGVSQNVVAALLQSKSAESIVSAPLTAPTVSPPSPMTNFPSSLRECEVGRTPIWSTWEFTGSSGQGRAANGAIEVLTIEQFDGNAVVILRKDPFGHSAGLTAKYTGKIEGDHIAGEVTWSWRGNTTSGTWSATVLTNASPATAGIEPVTKVAPHPLASYDQAILQGDGAEAVRLAKTAAQDGDAGAQFSLGLCYAQGVTGNVDEPEARLWMNKAAEQGYAPAQRYLICIRKEMTDAFIKLRANADQDGPWAGLNSALGSIMPTEHSSNYRIKFLFTDKTTEPSDEFDCTVEFLAKREIAPREGADDDEKAVAKIDSAAMSAVPIVQTFTIQRLSDKKYTITISSYGSSRGIRIALSKPYVAVVELP